MKGIGLYDSDFPTIKSDKELIMENVKRVITTLPGENVGNLNFGCKIREYLFDFENILLEDAELAVISAIEKWEPRVIIHSVDVFLDEEMSGKLYIIMNLSLRETFEKFNMELPILF